MKIPIPSDRRNEARMHDTYEIEVIAVSRPKLTPQQMAERRYGRAVVINAIACPVCLAGVGLPCTGTRQPIRLSPHRERIQLASKINRGSQPTRPDSEILPAEGPPTEA